MKQLTKNVPAESDLLFGDDLKKKRTVRQLNNALAKPAFIKTSQNSRYNKRQVP